MARAFRASSSISASHSRVAETLRFLAAASAIVVSIWRLITFRFSCWSFCSRGVMGVLSGFEDEGVIFHQRYGIGGEFVQVRIAQPERRLRTARATLLAQNVRYVFGAESAGLSSFLNGCGHIFRAVLSYELQEFGYLTAKRAVRIRHVAKIRLHESP